MREVLLRAHHEPIRAREVAEGFRERLPMAVEMQEAADLLAGDLLGEQRAQHDGGGARILEAPHRVEVVRERRGARDERMCELQTQVCGREVHDASSPHAASEVTRTNRHASGLRGKADHRGSVRRNLCDIGEQSRVFFALMMRRPVRGNGQTR